MFSHVMRCLLKILKRCSFYLYIYYSVNTLLTSSRGRKRGGKHTQPNIPISSNVITLPVDEVQITNVSIPGTSAQVDYSDLFNTIRKSFI